MTPQERYRKSAKGRAKARASRRKYRARPDVKAERARQQREYYRTPKGRARHKAYHARPEVKAKAAARRKTAAYRKYNREYARQRKSGITEAMFEALWLAQEGRCAVCRSKLLRRRAQRDHCHVTQTPRGLLCMTCNTVEGLLRKLKIPLLVFAKNLFRYLGNPPARTLGA